MFEVFNKALLYLTSFNLIYTLEIPQLTLRKTKYPIKVKGFGKSVARRLQGAGAVSSSGLLPMSLI